MELHGNSLLDVTVSCRNINYHTSIRRNYLRITRLPLFITRADVETKYKI